MMATKKEVYDLYRREWKNRLQKKGRIIKVPAKACNPGERPKTVMVDVLIEEEEQYCENCMNEQVYDCTHCSCNSDMDYMNNQQLERYLKAHKQNGFHFPS